MRFKPTLRVNKPIGRLVGLEKSDCSLGNERGIRKVRRNGAVFLNIVRKAEIL